MKYSNTYYTSMESIWDFGKNRTDRTLVSGQIRRDGHPSGITARSCTRPVAVAITAYLVG